MASRHCNCFFKTSKLRASSCTEHLANLACTSFRNCTTSCNLTLHSAPQKSGSDGGAVRKASRTVRVNAAKSRGGRPRPFLLAPSLTRT
eukprot:3391829-Lingulodinium_polyedra.AAC.1